ncbi:MAG: hypothetical protein ACI81G_001962, partial [Gammaproteobacteria bacterium]
MRLLLAYLMLCGITLYGQSDTGVYLFDLTTDSSGTQLSNQRNISNNKGYNNQPSFYNDNQVLFASTRNGQTDIAAYNVRDSEITWINDTGFGSEYSPIKIPDQKAVSAIRLDTNGLQRLYRYDFESGNSELLIKDLVIGYHVWFNDHIILSAVLADGDLNLVRSNLKDGTNVTLQKNIGRSLHNIPNTQRISYVSKETDDWEIKSINPLSGATKKIISIGKESEDYCWLIDGSIVLSNKNYLLKFDAKTDNRWIRLKTFTDPNIWNISRVATNSISTQIAIVSEVSPDVIVQKHIAAFNAEDRPAYFNCFSNNVVIQNYPEQVRYKGLDQLKKDYNNFFDRTNNLKVEVVKRMISGNKVIYEEISAADGKKQRHATIFEVASGKITSMTFIPANGKSQEEEITEQIVQKQLDAYNARDIDAFMNTYSDDIKLYNHPSELSSEGQIAMREGYAGYFKNTKDLHCEIKNRIVIGNKVIDQGYIT